MGARGVTCALALALAGGVAAETLPPPQAEEAPMATTDPQALLDLWRAGVRDRAVAAGVAPATVDAALATVVWLPEVVERDRAQGEFTRAIGDYMARAVSQDRIDAGRAALERHGALLEAIAARHGVDAHVIAAIWGLESSYGVVRGDIPTLSALATLAAEGRRGAFFEAQFIAALRILSSGAATPDDLRGSWAGAMGHTQFMPGTYLDHAVDFDGDGRRDIWGDDPADALASAAAYLAHWGWVAGQPWGMEVVLPDGFDHMQARDTNRQSVAYWNAIGLRTIDGTPLPDHGTATILLPAGAAGPAFAAFRNFTVIERYNLADAYVIAVGLLSDRLRGGPPLRASWPEGDRALTGAERRELQALLTAAGFDTLGVDGLIGPRTLSAVRAWQRATGRIADGYPSPAVLEALRAGAQPE